VMQHEQDAGHLFGSRGVEYTNAPAGDGALHCDGVNQAGKVVIDGVLRGARVFKGPSMRGTAAPITLAASGSVAAVVIEISLGFRLWPV